MESRDKEMLGKRENAQKLRVVYRDCSECWGKGFSDERRGMHVMDECCTCVCNDHNEMY